MITTDPTKTMTTTTTLLITNQTELRISPSVEKESSVFFSCALAQRNFVTYSQQSLSVVDGLVYQ